MQSSQKNSYHPEISLRKINQFTISGLIAVTMGLSGTVIAQDSDMEDDFVIEEVVVTAQQREQNLQEVPISIAAFTSDTIDKFMFSDVGDYLIRTPNASFSTDGSKSRRRLSIRGVTDFLAINNTLKSSTFGFYMDGFSIAGSTANPPIMDIERIEILRGPQATYFGRNALGGGINITSNKPGNEFGGSVVLDYSRFNTIDAQAIVNIPLIQDVLAIRVNAKYVESDGNIKNINETGGGNDSEYKYGKASLRWTPTEQLTFDLTISSASEKVGMREGVPTGVFSTFAGGTLYAGEFPDRDGDGRSDPDIDGVGFYPDNRNRVNFNTPQKVGTDFDYIVAQLNYDFTNLLFTSITGYIDSDFFLNGDIDGGSRDYFNEYRNIERESFSQEFRLQNTNDSPLQWNVGVIYSKDDGAIWNRTYIGAEERFGLPDGFLIDGQDDTAGNESWAVFGEVFYDVTDQLTVSAGGRYSEETINANIQGFSGGFVQVLTSEDTFTNFSPRVTALYDLNEDINFYGTVSQGFKSGGVQISPFPSGDSYDAETLWNYEVGMKGDFLDNRLRLNASLFYMDWTDLQTDFQQAGVTEDGEFILFSGTDNAESATSKGAELSLTGLISRNFVVNFDIGYLNAKFDKFTTFIDGENRVLDGSKIPLAPKWTLSADAEYSFDINADYSAYIRGEWSFRDSTKTLIAGLIQEGFPWEVPSYDFFNLRFGLEHQKYAIVAYVENIFDSVYYTNAYQKAFTGGLYAEPSFRTYGVRGTFFFGND